MSKEHFKRYKSWNKFNKNGIRFIGHKENNRLEVKIKVFNMTDGRCFYCFERLDFDSFTIDHVIPRSKNGPDIIENYVPCCERCNVEKGSQDADEYLRSKLNVKRFIKIINFFKGVIQ